ncbi:hypothetical protein FRB99_001558 [Tulasnella sp. 403]|nr:hypothetical protein FRB99_001558 [Tulasnella sp. 403]
MLLRVIVVVLSATVLLAQAAVLAVTPSSGRVKHSGGAFTPRAHLRYFPNIRSRERRETPIKDRIESLLTARHDFEWGISNTTSDQATKNEQELASLIELWNRQNPNPKTKQDKALQTTYNAILADLNAPHQSDLSGENVDALTKSLKAYLTNSPQQTDPTLAKARADKLRRIVQDQGHPDPALDPNQDQNDQKEEDHSSYHNWEVLMDLVEEVEEHLRVVLI